jgi:hypothetical protein
VDAHDGEASELPSPKVGGGASHYRADREWAETQSCHWRMLISRNIRIGSNEGDKPGWWETSRTAAARRRAVPTSLCTNLHLWA